MHLAGVLHMPPACGLGLCDAPSVSTCVTLFAVWVLMFACVSLYFAHVINMFGRFACSIQCSVSFLELFAALADGIRMFAYVIQHFA